MSKQNLLERPEKTQLDEVDFLKNELTDRYRELAVLTRMIERSQQFETAHHGTIAHRVAIFAKSVVRLFSISSEKVQIDANSHAFSLFLSDGLGRLVSNIVDDLSSKITPMETAAIVGKALADSGFFDEACYLQKNPSIKASGTSALEHYITVGCKKRSETVSMSEIV